MFDNPVLNQLHSFLSENNMDFTIFEDNFSLDSAASGAEHYGIEMRETTPTLILTSKDKVYAAIICGDTRISFKNLKSALNLKDVKMADRETVFKLTGSQVGEVSMINRKIVTILDKNVLRNEYCYGGSGAPRSTLKIKTEDLITITRAQVLDFAELR